MAKRQPLCMSKPANNFLNHTFTSFSNAGQQVTVISKESHFYKDMRQLCIYILIIWISASSNTGIVEQNLNFDNFLE